MAENLAGGSIHLKASETRSMNRENLNRRQSEISLLAAYINKTCEISKEKRLDENIFADCTWFIPDFDMTSQTFCQNL